MSRKISIILLIFILGMVLAGFLMVKRNKPTKSVDGIVIPFGIQKAVP